VIPANHPDQIPQNWISKRQIFPHATFAILLNENPGSKRLAVAWAQYWARLELVICLDSGLHRCLAYFRVGNTCRILDQIANEWSLPATAWPGLLARPDFGMFPAIQASRLTEDSRHRRVERNALVARSDKNARCHRQSIADAASRQPFCAGYNVQEAHPRDVLRSVSHVRIWHVIPVEYRHAHVRPIIHSNSCWDICFPAFPGTRPAW